MLDSEISSESSIQLEVDSVQSDQLQDLYENCSASLPTWLSGRLYTFSLISDQFYTSQYSTPYNKVCPESTHWYREQCKYSQSCTAWRSPKNSQAEKNSKSSLHRSIALPTELPGHLHIFSQFVITFFYMCR
jgi:hypothetical protein